MGGSSSSARAAEVAVDEYKTSYDFIYPNYSHGDIRYDYKGCWKDTATRTLPDYFIVKPAQSHTFYKWVRPSVFKCL